MTTPILTLVIALASLTPLACAHGESQSAPAPATPPAASAAPTSVPALAVAPLTMTWDVNGVKREAIVYLPATATTIPAPLVFAFHGHGGSGKQFARGSAFHKAWPEAIVVYPLGLPTAGMTDPKGLKAGWQCRDSSASNRDLAFFDAMLAGLKSQYTVDDRRIYSTGHSNGGGFTYFLWAQRAKLFAAFGPSAAGSAGARDAELIARPLIHIAGDADTIVPIAMQQRTLTAAQRLNNCESDGEPWAQYCTE